jgi:hypothetical protein
MEGLEARESLQGILTSYARLGAVAGQQRVVAALSFLVLESQIHVSENVPV